ncbi:MAG: hypothetical protein AAF356_04890 [Planctomycetota bacterium]
MNCTTCGYALWDLTSRTCPECGTGFKPSDFEFNLNSVRYCCPHCRQDYYGTGARGHLEPNAFDCVRCGQHIEMDEMVLLPTAGVSEDQTRAEAVPWLDGSDRQRKFRLLRCLFSTIGMSLVRPHVLGKALPHKSSLWRAQLFAVICGTAYTLAGFALMLVFLIGAPFLAGAGGGGPTPVQWIATMLGVFAGVVAATAIATLVMLWLWALCTHALLKIGGKPEGSLGDTGACLAYAHGAGVINAVPCLGQYVGWVWVLVSGVLIVKAHHRVHGGRAAFAVLTPPLTLIVLFVGAYVGWIAYIINATNSFTPNQTMVAERDEATLIADAASAHGRTLNEPWGNDHLLVLVRDERITLWDTVAGYTDTFPGDITIADVSLQSAADLEDPQLFADEIDRLLETIEPLPEDVIAHRLGDFVFAGHGVDFTGPANGVWVVILAPDPDQHAPQSWDTFVMVDELGRATTINRANFDGMLAVQNITRQAAGLEPLPHPGTITHDEPAVAE